MENTRILQTFCTTISSTLYSRRRALKHHSAIPLLLIMMIIISFVACGRNGETLEAETYAHEGAGPRPGNIIAEDDSTINIGQASDVQPIDRTQFYGETLTIYAVSRYSNNIAAIADEYMRQNPGITIEIISFGGNLSRAMQETSIALGDIALPAGAPPVIPPVLIESTLVNPNDTRHFENWIPFIDSTPNFNDNNFFMNVIDAMTVDSYLYEFPLAFSFSIILSPLLFSRL